MISTPLGDLIGLFQERFPRCSRILCGGLLLLTGILCGRLAVRYGLYPVSSTLTIPLYGLVACGILLGREYLTESVAAFVLLLSTRTSSPASATATRSEPCSGLRFSWGCCRCSMPRCFPCRCWSWPQHSASDGPCAKSSYRCAASYSLSWPSATSPGGREPIPWIPPPGLWHSFVSDSGYRIFANTPPLVPALLGIVLFIVLCAIFFGLISFRTVSIKARGMLTYTILLFTVTGCLIAVPSVTPGLLAVAAVPAALLMPLTFIRIQRTVGTLLYLILYITCIVNILQ